MIVRLFLLSVLLLVPAPLIARTWEIRVDSSGDAPTVQAGIDSAATGDTVLVGPGTYFENLKIVDKDIVLRGIQGPALTILDGSSQEETVVYLSGQTRATVIEGFTITGGVGHFRGDRHFGGGLYLAEGASPTIENNWIVANGNPDQTFFGGGISTHTPPPIVSSPLIRNSLFEYNEAALGGAIHVAVGDSEIRNCVFRNNSCPLDGGAIASVFRGSLTIEGNQFWDNYAGDHGGAIHIGGTSASRLQLIRNLFVRNRADGDGGGAIEGSGGAIRVSEVHGEIANNTFVENVTLGSCWGGAIATRTTPSNLHIRANLFALITSCAIRCGNFDPVEATLESNLFWMNEPQDISSLCPDTWPENQVYADPLFCGAETGNYTVSIESPALTGPVLIGVWTSPGCGPGVPVLPTTWGRIKTLYR